MAIRQLAIEKFEGSLEIRIGLERLIINFGEAQHLDRILAEGFGGLTLPALCASLSIARSIASRAMPVAMLNTSDGVRRC